MDSKAQDGCSSPSIKILAIPPISVEFFWNRVRKFVEKSVDKSRDDLSIESIKGNLISGDYLLVLASEDSKIIGLHIIEIYTFETDHKILHMLLTGGKDLDKWIKDSLDKIYALAIENNCVEIRGTCSRRGWLRTFNKIDDRVWYPVHETIGCRVKENMK